MSFRIPSMHEVDYVRNLDFKLTPNISAGKEAILLQKRRKKDRLNFIILI